MAILLFMMLDKLAAFETMSFLHASNSYQDFHILSYLTNLKTACPCHDLVIDFIFLRRHKGIVSNVIEGTSSISVDLDDGRTKTLELGKHGVRFISQKQKRART